MEIGARVRGRARVRVRVRARVRVRVQRWPRDLALDLGDLGRASCSRFGARVRG